MARQPGARSPVFRASLRGAGMIVKPAAKQVSIVDGAQTFDELLTKLEAVTSVEGRSARNLALAVGLDIRQDFRNADLRGIDFRGEDLRGFDFSGADLGGADLRGADLSGADLRGANI